MIRVPPGAVILDPAEVDYIGRVLEHLAELMAERRDERGQPTPSAPSPKLVALTSKLRRAAGDSAGMPTLSEPAADVERRPEPSVQSPVLIASVLDAQRDSVHAGPHDDDMGTAEAARRLGITSNGVRDLARRGRLDVRRIGHRWLVTAASVDAHAARQAAAQRR